jgi:hypothetical protein
MTDLQTATAETLVPMSAPTLPSAPAKISNVPMWLLVAFALVGPTVDAMVGTRSPWFPVAVNAVLLIYDARNVRRLHPSFAWWFWLILIPAYLFKRARILGQRQVLLWVWLGCLLAGLLVANHDEIFGVPRCDGMYAKDTVTSVFAKIPSIKAAGVVAIDLRDRSEVSLVDSTRTCRAIVKASNGTDYRITYTLEWTKDWRTLTWVALAQ